jgi:ribonuclease P protein component
MPGASWVASVFRPEAARLSAPRVIQTRAGFLAAARARRASTPSLIVQARARKAGERERGVLLDPDGWRVGYTCSKKVGTAVARNRAKRRLRAAAETVLPAAARPGWDYVLIGLSERTASRPFEALCADLADGLARIGAACP